MKQGVLFALLAAATFGASTPLAKLLVGQVAPVELAGLLYLGSGIGLTVWYAVRLLVSNDPLAAGGKLTKLDLPWLGGATLFGGIAGPSLLMLGLTHTPGSYASLLLNMEGVLTSILAWFVFKENFDRRIFVGMLLIVAGGAVLTWDQLPQQGLPWGAIFIVGACLCWCIDNNLTRRVSASDAVQIAATKGLVAGAVNLIIAKLLGQSFPQMSTALLAGLVGFGGYGLSLVLFVLALRNLGTARTGAYFSAAPFVGAAVSLAMLRELPGSGFWTAAGFMGAGIWLHLTEKHAHGHAHEELEHGHKHVHDDHHKHHHDFDWDGTEPHAHVHRHAPLTHAHAHYPDIHHRHTH
jgi:drug/metabolite transporter (DMT)-like permease